MNVLIFSRKRLKINLEVEFDLETYKKCFSDYSNEKINELNDMIKMIEHSDEKNFSISEFNHKYQNVINLKEKEFLLEGFKKLNLKEISIFIESYISTFENFLISIDLNSFSAICECERVGVFKLKVWSAFSKSRFLAIFQNDNNKCLDIFIKDGYESFG